MPKLYRVAENTYVVADDIFIQREGSEGDWVSTEALTDDDLIELLAGESDLEDFDLDAESAMPWEEFIEIPREQWHKLLEEIET